MKVETGQSLLFIGDSITDAGRTGQFPPLGPGYVSILRSLAMSRRPELSLNFINRGIGGNTIRDLAARWEEVGSIRGKPPSAKKPRPFGRG